MVLKKSLPERPSQAPPLEVFPAEASVSSAENWPSAGPAPSHGDNTHVQGEFSFNWDTYEASSNHHGASNQLQTSTSPAKSDTNPFRRRRELSRDSGNAVPDLITFELDGSDAPQLQGSTSPVTTPLIPSPQLRTPNAISSPSPLFGGRSDRPTDPSPALDSLKVLQTTPPDGQPKHKEEISQNVPQVNVSSPSSNPSRIDSEATQAKIKQQRNEVYRIKHIRWYDASSAQNPRQSPILIQNANGPCPLLALVNALVLSTPSTIRTALFDALDSREQISLGFLIDAVFDELTSDRRRSSSTDLPDVTELYSFLITLHTGMNVNPCFVPNETNSTATVGQVFPGSFEETREMKLYGTFSIPLIHGWLPHQNEHVYQAFQRAAKTYEDAQNIQFREEELQSKVGAGEISPDERQLLDDVITINQFFVYWPTQLTAHGLETMNKYLQPGQIAILFRNDHFSTLYKEPRSGRLMSLVTDEGYATHDEIVWESLIDISGAHSEFCSGDFRSVSHTEQASSSTHEDLTGGGEWTTVQSKGTRSNRGRQPNSKVATGTTTRSTEKPTSQSVSGTSAQELHAATPPAHVRSASEQEDHDLALALQLQEEEEERQRNEAAARRAHENDLSEQYLARERPFQGRDTGEGPRIPQRRSGLRNPNANTTASSTSGGEQNDLPPPSYEQAAADRPFNPPSSHPASEHAPRGRTTAQSHSTPAYRTPQEIPMRSAGPAPRRLSARQSLMEQNAMPPPQGFRNPGGRRVDPAMNASSSGKEDKCLVM